MNTGFNSGSGVYPPRDYGSTSSRQGMNDGSFAGFSPTEFISLKESIASNVVYIKTSWHQLEKAMKIVGTPKDNPESRKKM